MSSKPNKPSTRKIRKKTSKTEQPAHPTPPAPTERERLVAHGMAQLKTEEPYLWRKIMMLD